MEQYTLNYSTKNIPTPSNQLYTRILLTKIEDVIQRMRWKVINETNIQENVKNNFGLKSIKYPSKVEELENFEKDLLDIIAKLEFKHRSNQFQKTMTADIKKIKRENETIVFSDKTKNLYKMEKEQKKQLVLNSITEKYQVARKDTYKSINQEATEVATKLGIEYRVNRLAKKNVFITLKDHKENFNNKPTCRLINPAKSEIGLASKSILREIVKEIKRKSNLNLWADTSAVLDWFKNITEPHKCKFTQLDIVDFYPSITKEILEKSLIFASKYRK